MGVAIHCATCPINIGCHGGCLRGDDLAEIARLRSVLRALLDTTPAERHDAQIWFPRVNAARRELGGRT